jgi:uncharacterized membrane protein
MVEQALSRPLAPADRGLAVRTITMQDIPDALGRGFADFMAMPSHAVFLVVIYPVVGLLLAAATASADVVPLLFPLVAGFALLGPVAALGLYEISRRRERGEAVSVADALRVRQSPALPAIIELAALMAVVFVAWLVAAMVLERVVIGTASVGSIPEFLGHVLSTPQGWLLIVLGHAVGFVFAAIAFALGAVSFPLLLDRGVDLRTAVLTSVRAIRANPKPMAAWALTIAVLMAAGSVPFFIGLAIVLPVLGHATWHMYRKLIPAD